MKNLFIKNLLENYFSKYFLKVKDIVPQYKTKTFVGLDIGTTSIKVVGINNSAEGHEIDKFAVEPVSQNDIKAAVSSCLSKANITTKLVNTSVSGQGVIIRYVLMPKMPLPDIKSSIILEADKYFPFPIDDVVMDCYILEERPAENKVFVLIAAAKKDLIEQRISLLSSLNLEAETIFTDSIAIANIFNVLGDNLKISDDSSASNKPFSIAIIHIGGTASNLNIIKNNIPCFTRDIFMGGNDFTKRISNLFGLDMKAAEELKLDSKDQKEKVLEACESILMNLLNEIKLSFDYFESENNIPVASLFLSGGAACLNGLDEVIKQNLGIEVKLWQPFSGLTINPALSKEDLASCANQLSVAIGSALK